ncbi:MAG: STAS domain-containing protein [Planctomycetota bacterium]|jgi:anti-anti-sigma factor
MRIERKSDGDIEVLTLTGEFDATEVPNIEKEIDALVDDYRTRIVMDFSNLRWIDSSALGCLIRTQTRLRPLGGEQVLASPEGLVKTTIKTVGIDRMMRIFPDANEARRYLDGHETARPAEFDGVPVDETRLGRTELEFELTARPGKKAVAKMLVPYENGATFKYPIDEGRATIDPVALEPGCELRVRFRQPFLDPDRVFQMEGRIAFATELERDPHGASKYRLDFTKVDEADRQALENFARTQDEIRKHGRPPD